MRERFETNRIGRSEIKEEPKASAPGTGRRGVLCPVVCLLSFFFFLPTVHASGGGGGEEPNWLGFAWRFFNFIVLAGILYWLLAAKIKAFLTGRREGIKTVLAEAVSAREEAEKKFRESSEKLDKAKEEIEKLGEMIRSQGLAEKEWILEEARKAAAKMREDTETRLEQELSKAGRDLRIEAVRLSTQMAEELLRRHIQAEDHETIVKDTIEKVAKSS
ncbi:MAG: ATP synthase F0 subunit B [Proteobacteria bacterium]|nr:ATP synthase F0 subunit B [Pseudomonadota bacterium]